MKTYTFITVHEPSGIELHRLECTMERAKEIAVEDCAKNEDVIELRVVNKEKNRVERLAYYLLIDDIDESGNLFSHVKEEINWHPYTHSELVKKGGEE